MNQRLFITSTGTGIGKTFITAALVRQARTLAKSVAAYKPVISGFDLSRAEESDTGILLRALDLPPTSENIARISKWRFKEPFAPSMAARLENRVLDFKELIAHGRKAMESTENIVLIEGVGGVMAPLTDKHAVLDWIEALGIEAVLVTGSYLGSLSHTLTALAVLMQRKIPIFAIIVNESDQSTVSLSATVEELSSRTRLPIIPVARRNSDDAGNEISELRGLLS
jgi:dethiobiotin synthetase